jgi:hypothetical protein
MEKQEERKDGRTEGREGTHCVVRVCARKELEKRYVLPIEVETAHMSLIATAVAVVYQVPVVSGQRSVVTTGHY